MTTVTIHQFNECSRCISMCTSTPASTADAIAAIRQSRISSVSSNVGIRKESTAQSGRVRVPERGDVVPMPRRRRAERLAADRRNERGAIVGIRLHRAVRVRVSDLQGRRVVIPVNRTFNHEQPTVGVDDPDVCCTMTHWATSYPESAARLTGRFVARETDAVQPCLRRSSGSRPLPLRSTQRSTSSA